MRDALIWKVLKEEMYELVGGLGNCLSYEFMSIEKNLHFSSNFTFITSNVCPISGKPSYPEISARFLSRIDIEF